MKPIPDDIEDMLDETLEHASLLASFFKSHKINDINALKVCSAFTLSWIRDVTEADIPITALRDLLQGIHSEHMSFLDKCEEILKEEKKE